MRICRLITRLILKVIVPRSLSFGYADYYG